MNEFGLRHRVKQNFAEVGHLHAHRRGIEGSAHRVLHPAIGDQYPQRRQVRAQRHEESNEQVLHAAQSVPAEEHQPDEGRLEEEGHQPFDGQRRAEDVAHVMGVIGPIGAEFEFHGEARCDPQHEIDTEQLAPEAGDHAPDRPLGDDINTLHDDQHEGEAKRQRHKQEMIHGCQRELQPG